MSKKNLTPAFAYLRVSGLTQAKEGNGLARQAEAIEAFAKANGYTIKRTFEDAGVSGTIAQRAGIAEMAASVAMNGVRTIILESASRLGRDLIVSETILARFRGLDCNVIAADNGVDLANDDSPSSVMLRQMLSAVSQFQKSELVAKLKITRERIRESGKKCDGRKAFGQDSEQEQSTLERIKQLRRKIKGMPRLSLQKIASRLNQEGLPSRSGKPWGASSVNAVLKPAVGRS